MPMTAAEATRASMGGRQSEPDANARAWSPGPEK
jgi:hypothetical protein